MDRSMISMIYFVALLALFLIMIIATIAVIASRSRRRDEDDDEFELVSDYFDEMLDEQEFNELRSSWKMSRQCLMMRMPCYRMISM